MDMKFPVYMDNNATTAVDPAVLDAMLPYFKEQYGNAASRTHSYGWVAEEAVKIAREQVAALIGSEPGEIVFTSGATEAVNLALKGVGEAHGYAGKHIISCVTEHKAVLDSCKHLQKLGMEFTLLPVDSTGLIHLAELEAAIQENTVLISVMFANNETGVIQPVAEIGAIAKKHGILFFTDATQAVGKISVNVTEQPIDMLCLSAHKIYGPKGVGALYVRRKNPRVRLVAQMDGGGHEKNMRSGTLNVPGIVGLGKAAQLCMEQLHTRLTAIRGWRDALEQALLTRTRACLNGHPELRLPNVVNLSFSGVDGNRLLTEINRTVAVSSGSACTSANPEPSYVLKAMGLPDDLAKSSLRFGLGRFTTAEEVQYCIQQVEEVVNRLRRGAL